jgi:hypothetical protein
MTTLENLLMNDWVERILHPGWLLVPLNGLGKVCGVPGDPRETPRLRPPAAGDLIGSAPCCHAPVVAL